MIELSNFVEVDLKRNFVEKVKAIRDCKSKIVLIKLRSVKKREYLSGIIGFDKKDACFSLRPITKTPSLDLAIPYDNVGELFVNTGKLYFPN